MVETISLNACLPSCESDATFPLASRQRSLSGEPTFNSPSFSRWTREYDPDVSIALVGIRGTGLSTLAVIAASFLDFKLLDADHQFYQATGLSRAQYRSDHGAVQYLRTEIALLRSMLLGHPLKTIVVCGPGAVEAAGQALLSDYALNHPVIYVTRDIQGIQGHLRVWDTSKISSIHRASAPTFRSLSNFEFYNFTRVEDWKPFPHQGQTLHTPLVLKHVERDFLNFLRFVTQHHRKPDYHQEQLQLTPLDSRRYSYAMALYTPVPDSFWNEIRHEDILADAVELILPLAMIGVELGTFSTSAADYLTRQYYMAKSNTQLPVILNIQPFGRNSSSADQSERCYFDALHHGLRLGPDFLCVDLTCDQDMIHRLTAVKGSTKIIADYADSTPSLGSWEASKCTEKVVLAERVGANAVRLRQETTTTADNFAVRHLINSMTASLDHSIPIIAYNTGVLGQMSRFCGTHLNPVTDSRLQTQPIWSPYNQLLTVREAQGALYSSFILDAMFFGIYGNNVARSLSPAMHNAAFEGSGMPHTYEIFQCSTLRELEYLLSNPRLGGLSITAPFKSQVLPLVDEMSPEAQMIGAVNTLIPLRSGRNISLAERNRAGSSLALYGDNTDWIGITDCIRNNLSPINAIKRKTTALVVGAGGMARAATYALTRLSVRKIFIHNRTKDRAEALINHFVDLGILHTVGTSQRLGSEHDPNHEEVPPTMRILEEKVDTWPEDAEFPTIIISCVATKDVNGQCSVDTSLPPVWLANPNGGVVMELSYAPLETPLLRQVRKLSSHGWIAVDGLQMLPEQGKTQFELFTSRRAPIKLMREAVSRAYKQSIDDATETVQIV